MDTAEMIEAGERAGTMNRRRLLKGAAAAGIGVAAWSTPSITSIGGTPVYAAVCTQPVTSYEVSNRNTSCNCCGAGVANSSVRYKKLGGNCAPGPVFPGQVSLRDDSCTGLEIQENGDTATNSEAGCPVSNCPANPNGGAGLCVKPNDSGLTCAIRVEIRGNGACGGVLQTINLPPQTGDQFTYLPNVKRSTLPNCSVFIAIFVRCSSDPDCL